MFLLVRSCWSRILGVNKWWILPFLIVSGIIGTIFAFPLLLIVMMIGSRLLMIVLGPVNIWNTTWHTPPVSEIAGYYTVLETGRLPRGALVSKRSGFRLGADHRLEMTDVPDFDGFGSPSSCNYNGIGKWSSSEGLGVTLYLDIVVPTRSPAGNLASCGPSNVDLFQLLGHSPPYRIWYNIGDPDEGQGLVYVRRVR